MSIEVTVVSLLGDLRDTDQLRADQLQDLKRYGAETMVLLTISDRLDFAADGDDRRAAALSEVALQVLDAGGWAAVSGDLWSSWIGEREAADDGSVRVVVDMRAKTMAVSLPMRARIERWRVGRDDFSTGMRRGWPTITGALYGDPCVDDGQVVTIHGTLLPGEVEALGLGMVYVLGAPYGAF